MPFMVHRVNPNEQDEHHWTVRIYAIHAPPHAWTPWRQRRLSVDCKNRGWLTRLHNAWSVFSISRPQSPLNPRFVSSCEHRRVSLTRTRKYYILRRRARLMHKSMDFECLFHAFRKSETLTHARDFRRLCTTPRRWGSLFVASFGNSWVG